MRQAMNVSLFFIVLMIHSVLGEENSVNEYAMGGSDLEAADETMAHKKMSFNKDKRRQVQQQSQPNIVHHQFPYVQSGGMGGFPAPYNPPSFTQAYNPMGGGLNTNNNNPVDRLVLFLHFIIIQNLARIIYHDVT